ncbi:ABC transporter substrate-binding protein [soil metagenome]
MNRRRPTLLRPAAAALAAMSLLTLTGCADEPSSAAAATSAKVAELDPALHALLPADVRQRGVLRVGTDASYAPMSSFAPDGRTIIGAEPDLGVQLSRVLGVRVQFVNREFTRILPDVAAGRLDLGMSAMPDPTRREEQVAFVTSFSAGTAIVVQRGNPDGITDIKDLCGKRVAVEDGTTQVDLIARAQSNCTHPIKMQLFPTNSDALVQLRTGRSAAVLNDLPPAAFLVSDRRTSAQYQLASTTQYEPGLYGVAVAQDNPSLRGAVQGALQQLVRTGIYTDVLARWGVQGGRIRAVTVNSGS